MHLQHEDNFESKIQRDIPLLLLSPDDKKRTVASEIAIKKKKPNNFELMIDMIKSFNDVCSSKLLIRNFGEMISHG